MILMVSGINHCDDAFVDHDILAGFPFDLIQLMSEKYKFDSCTSKVLAIRYNNGFVHEVEYDQDK